MKTQEELMLWLSENTELSKSSVYKYTRAINTISNEMLEYNVISTDLFSMSLLQLDQKLPLVLNNDYFTRKNKTGNNMYSTALKHYRMFRAATLDVETAEDILSKIDNVNSITDTERMALVKSRVGQGEFRTKLLKKYNSSCIITGISTPKLLIASHIKPWAISDNIERLSEDNGLLLSPTYDKLFDCGLITFSNEGSIFISSRINNRDVGILGLRQGDTYNLRINNTVKRNLEYHRDVLFVK